MAEKTYPDIAPVGTNCSYIRKGLLEPVEQFLSEDEIKDYYKGAIEAVTYNGSIWGFPWFMTTYALFLNMDIFEERNVKPPEDGIWTWEEFVAKLQELTYDSNGDGKKDVFGFHSFIKEGYYNTWGIITSDEAKLFSDDLSEFTFTSDEAISGLQKLVDLAQKYNVTPPEFGKQGPKEAWTAFVENKNIAVFPAGSWAVNVLRQREKEGKGFKFDVAGFPLGKLGMPNIIHPEFGAYGIFKEDEEAKKRVCISFLKFITAPEEQRKLKDYGVFPVRKSVGNIYLDDSYMIRIQENLNYTSPPPCHPNWLKIEPIIQNQIREAVTGKKSPKQALEDAKSSIISFLNTN
ncbi:MAG: multiple sugar transport system substrate-binding protein [Thermosediminibacterales bacterium]|nr:multiple sugar transport system substrate-binding protein [Thermosediminibacterales bacterium]MDK2836590.1 multiple sugar transport system substrate-binding protein [Thermosediminibacterales bacterium]